MSHAALLEPLDAGGVWSVARGLARNGASYKQHLMSCDRPRRNDLDGRRTLSEEALAAFTRFFLQTCLDQVRFMEELPQPNRLRDRIMIWAEEEVRGTCRHHRRVLQKPSSARRRHASRVRMCAKPVVRRASF